MNVGQKCLSCKRRMRPQRARAVDWPGTIAYHSHGVCGSCRKAQRRGAPPGPRRAWGAMPDKCVVCHRPLRHPEVKAADAPGTYSYAGHGLCARCVENPNGLVRPRVWGAAPCRGCGDMTRPCKTTPEQYPGTRPRRKAGFCHTCLRDGTAAPILAMAAQVAAWRNR